MVSEETVGRRRAPGHTKQLMVDSAVLLLRERGVAGVTVDAVLARSGAPRGSVYHHFPGGRDELILEAVRRAGDYIAAMVDEAAAGGDARQALRRFVRFWQRTLADTEYRAGCPVVAVAVDSREGMPQAADVVREVFAQWQAKLADLLVEDGFDSERAGRLATLVIAAIEGAVILCRSRRELGPLDDVLAEMAPLLEKS
ncbi:MAG TPA: TetR/AcrR family transcriptional regulator [Rugosimonospora sp.]|nr:TetR/AcrR family transcriptional regulator [Rugosimonospora sp.]